MSKEEFYCQWQQIVQNDKEKEAQGIRTTTFTPYSPCWSCLVKTAEECPVKCFIPYIQSSAPRSSEQQKDDSKRIRPLFPQSPSADIQLPRDSGMSGMEHQMYDDEAQQHCGSSD